MNPVNSGCTGLVEAPAYCSRADEHGCLKEAITAVETTGFAVISSLLRNEDLESVRNVSGTPNLIWGWCYQQNSNSGHRDLHALTGCYRSTQECECILDRSCTSVHSSFSEQLIERLYPASAKIARCSHSCSLSYHQASCQAQGLCLGDSNGMLGYRRS